MKDEYEIKIFVDDCPLNPFEEEQFFENEVTDYLLLVKNNPKAVGIDVYEHGGYSLSINEESTEYLHALARGERNVFAPPSRGGWDTTTLGLMWVPTEEEVARIEELGMSQYEYAESIVELYENYLNGECYYYTVEIDDWEDSCSGFFGSDHEKSGLIDCATAAAEGYLKLKRKKRYHYIKTCIKNRVPLIYR